MGWVRMGWKGWIGWVGRRGLGAITDAKGGCDGWIGLDGTFGFDGCDEWNRYVVWDGWD